MGQALGMSVLGSDPYVTDPPDGVRMVDLRANAWHPVRTSLAYTSRRHLRPSA